MRVNESAAASTKVVGAAAIISRALYRVLTFIGCLRHSGLDPESPVHNESRSN